MKSTLAPAARRTGRFPALRQTLRQMTRRWLAAPLLAAICLGLPPLTAAADAQEDSEPIRISGDLRVQSNGWLGFAYDLDVDGIVVQQVVDDSPADEAGLEKYDLLLRVNGRDATIRYLSEMSAELEPGDTVQLRIRRNGDEREVQIVAAERGSPFALYLGGNSPLMVQLDELNGRVRVLLDSTMAMIDTIDIEIPEFEFERGDSAFYLRLGDNRVRFDTIDLENFSYWASAGGFFDSIESGWASHPFAVWSPFGAHAVAGAELEELNPDLAEYFETEYGLLVVNVSEGTPADHAGLEPGDVVVSAAGESVRSLNDLREALFDAPEDEPFMIEVIRHGDRHTLEIQHE